MALLHSRAALSASTLGMVSRQCRAAAAYYAEVTDSARALQVQATYASATVPCYREPLEELANAARATLLRLVRRVLVSDAGRLQSVAARLASNANPDSCKALAAQVAALQTQLQTVVYPAVKAAIGSHRTLHKLGPDFIVPKAASKGARATQSNNVLPCALGAWTYAILVPGATMSAVA